MPEVTLDAEYSRVYRKRISVCERLRREIDARDIIEVICNAHNVPMDCSFQNINYDSERLKVGQTVGNRLGALDAKPTPMAHFI